MPRVFACLAVGELIVLVGTGALGLFHLDPRADRHILLAVFAMLLTCLIQVTAFTYLTVTGKTIGQAVHLADLDASALGEAKRIKRSLARYLAAVMLAVVFATATGANLWRVGDGRRAHLAAALVVVLAHVLVLSRQYFLIVVNARLVERTLAEYTRRRTSRAAGSTRQAGAWE